MNRKAIAQETLRIQQQGYYTVGERRIDIGRQQEYAQQNSFLLTPEEGAALVRDIELPKDGTTAAYQVVNQSTMRAIEDMYREGKHPAVLNFASAKNPGGGFLGGAMAQEEALAASSGLYNTLLLHEGYYKANRGCGTMVYTDHAIYSPEVPFFRDDAFELLEEPATASVLTLPAVNMGQVLLKGEDVAQAKAAMKSRMRLCLTIFAQQKNRHLILGAYGCGVFRNNPEEVAAWWKQLLEEGFSRCFEEIVFAVLDRSGKCIQPFTQLFG